MSSRKVKIVEKKSLTAETVGLKLSFADKKPFVFHPGQFVMLSLFGFGEIPVAPTTSPDEKGFIEVAVRVVGGVTEAICRLEEGDELFLRGPFGNGFAIEKLKGKDVVLVAGGIGIAPLRSLIHHAGLNPKIFKSLTIINGARTPELLLYSEEYAAWEKFAKVFMAVDTCDKNWKGCKGSVTRLFDQAEIKRGSVMITCGPPVMFPAVAKYFAGKRVAESDLYFLLERRMKCGIGKCQHCTCGKAYVCLDGPVFSYDQLKYNPEAFK